MAKIKGPLMSVSAQGTIGERLTFSERKSGQQVRFQKAQIIKDVGYKQLDNQALYRLIYSYWSSFSDSEKAVWNDLAVSQDLTYYAPMLFNGEIPTSVGTIYTAPLPTPGITRSGANVEIDFFRIVNESGVARTFTIYVSIDGTRRAITPIDTQLPIGAAFDDLPVFQIPPGALIEADADGASVSWSINAVVL